MRRMNYCLQQFFAARSGKAPLLAAQAVRIVEIVTIINGLGVSVNGANFGFTQSQLAGGINTPANAYTAFSRKLLDRSLIAGTQLNANAVCTNN